MIAQTIIYENPGAISPTKAAQLARLITAYAAEHPEIFERENSDGGHDYKSEEKVQGVSHFTA